MTITIIDQLRNILFVYIYDFGLLIITFNTIVIPSVRTVPKYQ